MNGDYRVSTQQRGRGGEGGETATILFLLSVKVIREILVSSISKRLLRTISLLAYARKFSENFF